MGADGMKLGEEDVHASPFDASMVVFVCDHVMKHHQRTTFGEVEVHNNDTWGLMKTLVFMAWYGDNRKDVDIDVEQNVWVVNTFFDILWNCFIEHFCCESLEDVSVFQVAFEVQIYDLRTAEILCFFRNDFVDVMDGLGRLKAFEVSHKCPGIRR